METVSSAEASASSSAEGSSQPVLPGYRQTVAVRLDEIDFNGHLHNTKYLEYSSHTRYSHLVESGWDLRRMKEHGVGVVALSDEIQYHREVGIGGLVIVHYNVTGYSEDGSRWRSRVRVIRPDGVVAATVITHGAWIGLQSRRIQSPPAALVATADPIRSDDFEVL